MPLRALFLGFHTVLASADFVFSIYFLEKFFQEYHQCQTDLKGYQQRTKTVLSRQILVLSNIFLCPQRNFGRHIVIALSVRLPVCPSHFRVRSISPIFFEVGISN